MSFKAVPVATFMSGKRKETEFLCSFRVLPLDQGQRQQAAVLRCTVILMEMQRTLTAQNH